MNHYLYAGGNPIRWIDPTGLASSNVELINDGGGGGPRIPPTPEEWADMYYRWDTNNNLPPQNPIVFLGTHEVYGSGYHTGLIILVDPRSVYKFNEIFTNTDTVLYNRRRWLIGTLGAQAMDGVGTKLEAVYNRPGDIGVFNGLMKNSFTVPLSTTTAQVDTLLASDAYFRANHNNTLYYPHIFVGKEWDILRALDVPVYGGNVVATAVSLTRLGYTSNSYTRGLLDVAGIYKRNWFLDGHRDKPDIIGVWVPGWDRPVQTKYFR